MAAAQQLTRAGHTVAVFERDDAIGGLMRYGVPDFKLEKRHIDRRMEQMEAEGTRFRPGIEIGVDILWSDLRARYDAVVVATGAPVPRELDVPGKELVGVHFAMEYLHQANAVQSGRRVRDQIVATGKHVIIIGGGDTGADCLGTSHRQGAASVTQLEIMPRPPEDRAGDNPWPQWSLVYRTSSAHEEGGERVFSVNTERFVDDGAGNVKGLLLHEVEMVDGKFQKVEGSDRELPADLVLLAMGFVGPEKGSWLERLGVELDERGNVRRDDTFMSNVPGVFVAGDMGRGQSLIVWAIAEGRAAAGAVDTWLTGASMLPRPITPTAVALR
jgi:glutamate synthase (NADPH/NADH) small chain